jgi:hypothetical protein
MAKLRPGAVTIDLETGGIYGDLDHCLREDLLESAEALLSLLPQVNHEGLWRLGKAWDADCYLYTDRASYKVPEDVRLELYLGNDMAGRRFSFVPLGKTERDTYWQYHWYSRLVGSVRDGKVTPDTEEIRRREASKPRQLSLGLEV